MLNQSNAPLVPPVRVGEDVDVFAEGDEEVDTRLSELMRELVADGGKELLRSQLSARSREKDAEAAAETLEMSQVWWDDDDRHQEAEGKALRDGSPDGVWNSDDDDDFWNVIVTENVP